MGMVTKNRVARLGYSIQTGCVVGSVYRLTSLKNLQHWSGNNANLEFKGIKKKFAA
jgi:hypothetical protein